jgi:hypothetical protein
MVDEDADRRAWHSAGYLREGEAASPAFRS